MSTENLHLDTKLTGGHDGGSNCAECSRGNRTHQQKISVFFLQDIWRTVVQVSELTITSQRFCRKCKCDDSACDFCTLYLGCRQSNSYAHQCNLDVGCVRTLKSEVTKRHFPKKRNARYVTGWLQPDYTESLHSMRCGKRGKLALTLSVRPRRFLRSGWVEEKRK